MVPTLQRGSSQYSKGVQRIFQQTSGIHWNRWEARENRENQEAALRIDPNFVLANLYINMNDPVLNRNFRNRAIEHKDKVSNAEKYQVEMQMAYRDGKQNEAVTIG